MFNNATLCLNMIVKNEAHIIEDTLENLCLYFDFDYWVIADTGSNDNTNGLIKNFFTKRGIPGELLKHNWRDFGFNRTQALEAAYNKTDYILFWDADDKMKGNFPAQHLEPKKMYYLKKTHGISNYVPLLVSNRVKWEYKGVLHEYLNNKEEISLQDRHWVVGDYEIKHDANGGSYNDPDKYIKHGALLEKAYAEEEDGILKNRYAFYCAQSYKDCYDFDKAIKWYVIASQQKNSWIQEKYYSYLMLGKLFFVKGKEYFLDAILNLEKGMKIDSSRPECLSYLMEYYYIQGAHAHVMSWYYYFMCNKLNDKIENSNPCDKLFFDSSRYYYIYYYASICAYYVGSMETGAQATKFLMEHKDDLPEFMRDVVFDNRFFYIKV